MSASSSSLDSSFILVEDTRKDTPSAHDWSPKATGGINISGRHFVDSYGRVCGLRGVNISGACKTPSDDDHNAFFDKHEHVTFVGRPFPLEEAPDHFARLRRWGLTFIRFLVTWEALEHEGPGKYDLEYLEYLRAILSLLPEYGMVAFVSMHQDVWSRYTGGSGAPAWTIAAIGLDLHKLEDAGAAWLKGVLGGGHIEAERGLWPCGYQKLGAATMNTCFWAGNTFAPKLKIDGVPVQEYLQTRFLKAWELLARTVGHLDGVLGFEMMNEPHRGYIELPSMHAFDYNTDLHLAHVPSALQSFALGAGHAMLVPHYSRSFPMPSKLTSHEVVNEKKVSVWSSDGPTEGRCLWEWHGVWGWDNKKDEAIVLRENYFVKHPMTGQKIDWYDDFYYPLIQKWADIVRSVSSPDKIVFTEAIPNEFCPSSWTIDKRPPNMAYAPHWYDLNALFQKAFGEFSVNVQGLSRGMFPLKAFYWGQHGARENFSLQIRNIVEAAYSSLGETPVIMGECGIPMDMNRGDAFRTDHWTPQARMMDAMITGLERSLIGFTLWNYNPDNTDQHGDYWNGENFSWFSRHRSRLASSDKGRSYDQTDTSLDEGARILRSIVRPYPAKTSGIPTKLDYELNSGRLLYEWANPFPSKARDSDSSPKIQPPLEGLNHELKSNETLIFYPSMLSRGRKLVVEGLRDGDNYRYDEEIQTIFITVRDNSPGARHSITISLEPPLPVLFPINTFMSDFGFKVYGIAAILFALIAYIFSS